MIQIGALRKLVLCLGFVLIAGMAPPPAPAAVVAAPLANLDFEQGEPGKEPPGREVRAQPVAYRVACRIA
ncbi:MAG TPA: hypothetical protein VGR07_03395 [Thermoanaerobaculia bacterium]|nr:hypothetical protein [Thermoanaerobaculia bacterium]